MLLRVARKWLPEMVAYKVKKTERKKKKNNTLWNQTRVGNGYQILIKFFFCIIVFIVDLCCVSCIFFFKHKPSSTLLIWLLKS